RCLHKRPSLAVPTIGDIHDVPRFINRDRVRRFQFRLTNGTQTEFFDLHTSGGVLDHTRTRTTENRREHLTRPIHRYSTHTRARYRRHERTVRFELLDPVVTSVRDPNIPRRIDRYPSRFAESVFTRATRYRCSNTTGRATSRVKDLYLVARSIRNINVPRGIRGYLHRRKGPEQVRRASDRERRHQCSTGRIVGLYCWALCFHNIYIVVRGIHRHTREEVTACAKRGWRRHQNMRGIEPIDQLVRC